MSPASQSRRDFLLLAGSAAASMCLPGGARVDVGGKVRFGVISDIHQDVMHDGLARVTAFVNAMRETRPDFVIQLGDFCQPKPANKTFLQAWNRFDGPRHHVLGNHDMDGGFTRDQAAAWLGMPSRYYAFERGGVRFVVLDGNDPGGTSSGYPRFIGATQREWLEAELESTRIPVVVFVHQPLESSGGIVNQEEIRGVLERPRGPGHAGVAAVFSGHLHEDYVVRIGGLAHLQINSASYVWLPAAARKQVYDEATHRAHPNLQQVAPYRKPLWAVVTLDLDAGKLTVQGRKSEWVGPDPWERGAPASDYPAAKCRPAISDWQGLVGE